MHRSTVTHVSVTPTTVIVASADGRVTFWNREPQNASPVAPEQIQSEGPSARLSAENSSKPLALTFIKSFQAHRGPLSVLHVTSSYDVCLTISESDSSLKLFNIQTYDMSQFTLLPFAPAGALCTISDPDRVIIPLKGEYRLAIIPLHDISTTPRYVSSPLKTQLLHIAHNPKFSALVLCDISSVLSYAVVPEYRHHSADDDNGFDESVNRKHTDTNSSSIDTLSLDVPHVTFHSRLRTDLYTHAKSRTTITSMSVSPTGTDFATTSLDCRVRIFDFLTGRLRRVFDETPPTPTSRPSCIPSSQFVRRLAREKQLQADRNASSLANVVWDESGSFVLYSTVLGIKLVHVSSNRVPAILGLQESAVRFTNIDLAKTVSGPLEETSHQNLHMSSSGPLLASAAFESERIFLFGTGAAIQEENRDVYNEKPMAKKYVSGSSAAEDARERDGGLITTSRATLHTTVGDISLELFVSSAPRTVENFTTHAQNGYFDGVPFHRVIKGFMIQTGDPGGDGTGGESIWGGEFDDEIDNALKHEPGVVSMANAGPNTNGSQFFIVCGPASHLDGKHTIFGMLVILASDFALHFYTNVVIKYRISLLTTGLLSSCLQMSIFIRNQNSCRPCDKRDGGRATNRGRGDRQTRPPSE